MSQTTDVALWYVSADVSPAARLVQQRLHKHLHGFRLSDWFLPDRRHMGPVDLRDCGFGMPRTHSSHKSQRWCYLKDHMRRVVGYVELAQGLWGLLSKKTDVVDRYCGVLLADGTTFEVFQPAGEPQVMSACCQGVEVCRLQQFPSDAPPASGWWQQLKRLIVLQNWEVLVGAERVGEIRLDSENQSRDSMIYFDCDFGRLPIRWMPSFVPWGFDPVIPADTPAPRDPLIERIHFMLNIAFRVLLPQMAMQSR